MSWFGDTGALGSAGMVLGGLGTLYGAYTQNQAAKRALDWEKKVWNQEQVQQNQAQANLDAAVDSVYDAPLGALDYGRKKKKPEWGVY